MVDVNTLFNSTGEVGSWLSTSTNNFTGSLELSLFVLFGFLLMVALLFKMPQLLYVVALLPVVVVFSVVSLSMASVLVIFILVLAVGLYALFPIK